MTPSTSRLLLLSQQKKWLAPSQQWSLANILHLVSSHQLTCEQLARYCHATAVAGEKVWNLRAFSRLVSWATVQEAAQNADQRRRDGTPKSLLDGIPLSVKANLAVEHQALTAGSYILGEGSSSKMPAVGYNAELVQRLVQDGGAICIGITNMDEFGMGSLGTSTAKVGDRQLVATKNPLAYLLPTNNIDNEEGSISSLSLLDILQQSQEQIWAAHEEALANATASSSSSNDADHYSAGGSSCGAAASIAHGSSLIALASDTGGSIRLPAAWCRVAGLKPSYGRFSRHGLVGYASSLDTVGFLTPTVACASLVLDQIVMIQSKNQQQPNDSTAHYAHNAMDAPQRKTARDKPLQGVKIGIPAAFVVQECPESVKELWAKGAATLEQAGATLVTLSHDIISPDIIQQSLAAYYVLACAEASSNLARYDGFRYGLAASLDNAKNGNSKSNQSEPSTKASTTELQKQYAATRTQGFGLEVIRRIFCGTAVLSSDKFHTHYEAAAKLRAVVTKQLHGALTSQVDFLLIPSVLSPPPRLSGTLDGIDSTAMFANDIFTVPISLAGLAAVNIPFHTGESGSSFESVTGLQLVGRRLEEERLLSVGTRLEELAR